jgi:hypothetical protein
MNRKIRQVVTSVEKNVTRLIDACRKNGPPYEQNPQGVAHVSRTSKWLLNAIGRGRTRKKLLLAWGPWKQGQNQEMLTGGRRKSK